MTKKNLRVHSTPGSTTTQDPVICLEQLAEYLALAGNALGTACKHLEQAFQLAKDHPEAKYLMRPIGFCSEHAIPIVETVEDVRGLLEIIARHPKGPE